MEREILRACVSRQSSQIPVSHLYGPEERTQNVHTLCVVYQVSTDSSLTGRLRACVVNMGNLQIPFHWLTKLCSKIANHVNSEAACSAWWSLCFQTIPVLFQSSGKRMDTEPHTGINLRVSQLNKSAWLVSISEHQNRTYLDLTAVSRAAYDGEGALYYVIAVLFMYALSIILMIGSLIKKSKQDNGMSKYMEDLDKVRKVERRQLKYKSRLAMHNNKKVARAIERRLSTPCAVEMQDMR